MSNMSVENKNTKINGLQEYSARQEQVRILMPKIMLHNKLPRAKVILDEVTTMEN